MTVVFYLFYMALGGAVGWASFAYAGFDLAYAVGTGIATTLCLGQLHLFIQRAQTTGGATDERLSAVEQAQKDTASRLDIVEARADAVESTLNHELTERRDALVTEMKTLESLIGRLSSRFDTRLEDASHTGLAAPEDDAILRAVKDALEAGRTDLHLQPIVSLPQRRVSFYEGFTRLRRENGALILPGDFLDAARRAGLMGIIDNMMLYRSVEVVRRLAARDRRVGVFCNVSLSSLEDPHFFPMFLEHMQKNRDLAGALIFEVRAANVATPSRAMQQAMQRLTSLGFRFSIDHADRLDLDLPRLQAAGVRFVKIKGDDLITQLRDHQGPRPKSAVNRPILGEEVASVCSRYGVTLIAEKIEEEVSVVEVLEYGIPYGQGHVFGAPRPIKSSLMEETAPPPELVARLTAAQR